jgi:hypothetical protein
LRASVGTLAMSSRKKTSVLKEVEELKDAIDDLEREA